MSYPFKPIAPVVVDCTPITNQDCNFTSSNDICPPSKGPSVYSGSVIYIGPDLVCLGVTTNETLNAVLEKINDLVCIPVTNEQILAAIGYTPEDLFNKQNTYTIDGTGTKYYTVDYINSIVAQDYATVVYFNSTDPNTATIFDDVNPPTTNDNALKNDTNNLYIGTDASTWIYDMTVFNYVTKSLPSISNFYFSGSSTDAGNDKIQPIKRMGSIEASSFIKTGGTSSQFLKADGSVDDTVYAAASDVTTKLQLKQNLPTGFVTGLPLSIKPLDNTKAIIGIGTYVVTDFSDLNNIVATIVNVTIPIEFTPSYLLTSPSTYVALDINKNVIQSASPFTDADRRTLCIVGNVVHSNNINITVVNEIKAPIIAPTNQLHDLIKAVGFLNLTGNLFSANGANLSINKTAGKIWGLGINANDYLDPHILTLGTLTAPTFRYRLSNSVEYPDTTVLDPTQYESSPGVLSPLTNSNKWGTHHINIFQSNIIRVQPPQHEYSSFVDARNAAFTESFTTETNIADNAIFRCYVVMKKTCTNLQADIAAGIAEIIHIGKFGNAVGGSNAALTLDNILAVLGYTPENIANKSDSYTASSSVTYASTKALVDGLSTKASIDTLFTAGRIPYTSNSNTLSDSSKLLWDTTNSYLEVNGTNPRFTIKNNINNYSSYFGNTTIGTLFLKNHQDKTLALFSNPLGTTNQPQLAIGQVSSIPVESQLFVYGGQTGANIDARGSSTTDEANIDLEGNDWNTNINSLGLSYFGSNATAFGTVMGYAKNKLGQIRFQDNNVSAITSYKETGVSPIRFGINDIQIANISDTGFSYQSDFSPTNSSNPRWLTDKAYVDVGLATKQNTLTNPTTGTGTSGQVSFWNGTTTQTGDNGLFWDNTNKRLGVGTATPSARLEVKGTTASDGAPLSAELATTATGTNWTGTSLPLGYTHTIGSSVVLTGANAAVIGTAYRIVFTVTGRTAGSFSADFGGVNYTSGRTTTIIAARQATTTGFLIITPTTDFDGTIAININSIGDSSPTTTFSDSFGSSTIEIRADLAGRENLFIGRAAGRKSVDVSSQNIRNTFIGALSGSKNYGRFNTALGYSTLANNSFGQSNTAIGSSVMELNTTGVDNTAVGTQSLSTNTVGNSNTAIGSISLQFNTIGAANTSIGAFSMQNNTTGGNNSALGYNSLLGNTTGGNNVALGVSSGRYIANGSTANTITNNSIFIGRDTKANADNETNQVVIGYNETGLGSNSTILGNSSTTKTAIRGRLLSGTTTDNGVDQVQVVGTISATGGTTANQVVVKSQLDEKQPLDTQIEIGVDSNVLNAWAEQTVIFTANCTITVPATLNNGLKFSFMTLSGVTVTWAITSPFTWEATPSTTPSLGVGFFMRRGSTNTIILRQ